jgi:hypothetical protein
MIACKRIDVQVPQRIQLSRLRSLSSPPDLSICHCVAPDKTAMYGEESVETPGYC